VLCHRIFPPVIAAKAAANRWQLLKILMTGRKTTASVD